MRISRFELFEQGGVVACALDQVEQVLRICSTTDAERKAGPGGALGHRFDPRRLGRMGLGGQRAAVEERALAAVVVHELLRHEIYAGAARSPGRAQRVQISEAAEAVEAFL